MSDEDAYMALALWNAQGELHPLEEGMHAIGANMEPKEYADRVGKSRTTVQDKVKAARVARAVETHMRLCDLRDQWRAVGELHGAPPWLWCSLVCSPMAITATMAAANLPQPPWQVSATSRACDVLRKCRVVSQLAECRATAVSRRLTHMNWNHIVYAAAALAVLAGSSAFTINIAEAHERGRHYGRYYGGGFGDPFFYRSPYSYNAPYDDTPHYDDGDCAWLQRNAVATGMRLWKSRYQECLRNRKK
jgi:hypothetical protein